MQRKIGWLVILSATLITASAGAQVRVVGNPGGPVRVRGPGRLVLPPGQNIVNMCNSRRAILTQEEQQLERHRANLAGADAELQQLQRRTNELRKQRVGLQQLVASAQGRAQQSKQDYDSQCSTNNNCSQYQTVAADLDKRGKVLEQQVGEVSTEMSASKTRISGLEARIEPLRKEYNDRRCSDLVPGETAQETIDRCSALFSEWNRLQADLNQENSRLAALKTRYQALYSELSAIDGRAQKFQTEVVKYCTTPTERQQIVLGHNYHDVRVRAEGMGKELDQLISTVGRLRGVNISISARPR